MGKMGSHVILKGRYQLVARLESSDGRELWEGAGGRWRAPAVIQILGESVPGGWESLRRRAESLRWPLLRHPNVEHILDQDEDGDTRFLVLRYCKGESIGERMSRDGSIDLAEALLAGKIAAEVVQAVHDLGQPLGGLSTADLLMTSDGSVIVTDVARTRPRPDLPASPPLTDVAEDPDPATSGSNDHRAPSTVRQSDLAGLVSLLYELITGHRPQSSRESDEVWAPRRDPAGTDAPAAAEAPSFTPLESAVPGISPELARVCNSVLSGGPAARLMTPGALARVLDRLLDELGGKGSPDADAHEVREPWSVWPGPSSAAVLDLEGTPPRIEIPDPFSEATDESKPSVRPGASQTETRNSVGGAIAKAFWRAGVARKDAPKVASKPAERRPQLPGSGASGEAVDSPVRAAFWRRRAPKHVPRSAEPSSIAALEPDRSAQSTIAGVTEGKDEVSGRRDRVVLAVLVTAVLAALAAWALIHPSKPLAPRPGGSHTVAGGSSPASVSPPQSSPTISAAPTALLPQMPDVRGMTIAEARDALAAEGLRVKTVVPVEGTPSEIVRTDPARGTAVQPGTEVTLFVGVSADRLSPSAPAG